MSYSLRQVVADGVVTAPRWVHHVAIKLAAQHTAPAFALWAFTRRPMLSALIAGPGVYALLFLHERIAPSDPAPHTFLEHLSDTATDGGLACAPIIGALVVTGEPWRALALACILGTLYALCHRNARP